MRKRIVVSKLDDDKKKFNHARSQITNILGASLFLPLPLNLQFMTFQCKKGYFWSIYCSGPHGVIPLELIRSNRDTVRKGQEAHLIHKGNTLSPLGINTRDEAH